MTTVYPCLWFDGNAEEAARFYAATISDSRVDRIWRSPAETPSGPAGMVLTVDFVLDGQRFTAINGGDQFHFDEAISLLIECADQDEVDHYWSRLSDGGEKGPCGWVKDRFGVSWQVNPTRLQELIDDPDPGRAQRAMQAMLGMQKIDIAELERAADGVPA